MMQTPQEKQKQPTRWFVPFPEKKAVTGHPCRDACNGNTKQGELLLYFLYEASWELDWQGLDKSCKVVKFTRSHKDILKRVNISEKTLVQFLKQFTTWGFVLSESYGKVFTIQAEPIHQAMYFPVFTKKLRQKSCTSTSEEGTTSDAAQESCNVYLLQEKVEALEQVQLYNIALEARVQVLSEAWQQESCKVVELQKNVEEGKLYNSTLSTWIEAVSQALCIPSPIDSIREESIDYIREKESNGALFVATPSSSSEQPPSPSYSQDSYKTSDVTQVSQESEAVHADLPLSAHPGLAGSRSEPPAVPVDDITGNAITADGHPVPDGTHSRDMSETDVAGNILESHGYEKGGRDESSTDSIWDRDTGGSGRDTALPPAPDQHCVGDPQEQDTRQTQTVQEVTQQTPLSQAMEPVLSGDASESNVTPPVAFPRLSHTPFYAELDVFAEDTWVMLPGRATGTVSGEVRVSAGDTSQSDAERIPTETTPMKPASPNKTAQGKENKKSRGTSAKPEKPVVPAEPEPDPLTAEERELYAAWCSLFHVDVDLTPSIINACQKLHKRVRAWAKRLEWTLAQTLDDMQKWNYANDSKDYYKKRGVKLYDLNREFEGWQSAKQEELRKKRTQSTETNELDRYKNSTTVIKRTEELRKRQTTGADIPATPLVARASTFSYDYR